MIVLDNGDKIFRLILYSPEAYSINLVFDNFFLSDDTELFIYNMDYSHTIGAFTSQNNKSFNRFSTSPVSGEKIIVEYYEPQHVTRNSIINISNIIQNSKNIFQNKSQNQTSLFSDDINKISYLINDKNSKNWSNDEILTKELQMLEMKNEIQSKVRTDLDKQQREYFLHQQMKAIQEELGGAGSGQETEEMRTRAKEKKWSKEVAESFKDRKSTRLNSSHW